MVLFASPKRATASFQPDYGGLKSSGLTKIDYRGNFQRSLSSLDRISVDNLRRFSRVVPVQKAKDRIANGVLAMPWRIMPPPDLLKDEAAIEEASAIKRALQQPNRGGGNQNHNTYSKFVRAIVGDLLDVGFAAVERQPKEREDSQPFWLWAVDAAKVHANPKWEPFFEGFDPRFYFIDGKERLPLMNKDLFIVQLRTCTYEYVPSSPLEVAYQLVAAWLGVSEFQSATVKRGVRSYMLSIEGEDVDDETLEYFRQYWRTEVEGKGEVAILAGKFNKIDLGAKNDDELYPRYTEYLLRLIGLAFNLVARDFNITEPDNKATASVSADHAFAQAVLPMAICIEEHIGIEVVDFYHPGFGFTYTDSEPRGEQEEATISTTLFEKGVITRNEARSRVGNETIPNGDVFMDGSKLMTPEEAKEAETAGVDEEEKPAPKEKVVPISKNSKKGKEKQVVAAGQMNLF